MMHDSCVKQIINCGADAAGSSDKITVVQETWYYISLNRIKDDTAILNVYDTNGDEITGSPVSASTFDADIGDVLIGFMATGGGSGYTGTMYFDDIWIDYTIDQQPLGP
jgi:hypothetical protein